MHGLNLMIKPASSLCNLRCEYCFYSDVAENRSVPCYGKMSIDTLEAIVRQAFSYADGYVSFAFQGGEPTLMGLDFYRELIRLQKQYNKKNLRVFHSLQTNGILIDHAWAEFLAENRFLVGLSLDGTREAHDTMRRDGNGAATYDRVIKAAECLSRHGVEFNILCVVNRYTARHPRKIYQALKKYGYIQFIPCLDGFSGEKAPFSLSAERYGAFLCGVFDGYYEDFVRGEYVSVRGFDNYVQMCMGLPPESCAMTGRCSCSPVIEGDGSVYPCDFYVLDDYRLGNVHTHGFAEMLAGDTALRFVTESLDTAAECTSCPYAALCRGGCRRERDAKTKKSRFCTAYRTFFAYAMPRLTEMAEILRKEQLNGRK